MESNEKSYKIWMEEEHTKIFPTAAVSSFQRRYVGCHIDIIVHLITIKEYLDSGNMVKINEHLIC